MRSTPAPAGGITSNDEMMIARRPVTRRRVDAVEIVPGLWVGSAPSAGQSATLVERGVDAVLDLRAEDDAKPLVWPDGVIVANAELRDHGTPTVAQLRGAAAMVKALVGNGRTVLVHCHAGVERAPMVACAVLVLQGWSLEDAYRRVSERRPQALPTDGQLAALRALAAQPAER